MTKLSQFCLKASLSVQTLTIFFQTFTNLFWKASLNVLTLKKTLTVFCCWMASLSVQTLTVFVVVEGFPCKLIISLWFVSKSFTNLFWKASLSVLTLKKNSKASLSVQTLTVFCFFEGFSLFYLMASPSVLTLIFPFVSKSLCQKFQKKFGKASRTLTIFFVGWLPFVSKVFLYLMASPSVQTWILWLP